ncbi:putative UbiX-like flavin prenyltransferase [Spirochaetia bacterium]|nr:putative UbiX-like flavin prenyltransferase [Spirochaetia bacterium]
MKIAVGITGASGAIYGIRLLEELKALEAETHLVISPWGEYTITEETGRTVEEVKGLASYWYGEKDMAASLSSGSFPLDAMVIAPCSMKTLAGIASGFTEDLIIRSADVCLKERRKLILLARESPLSLIHLENMLTATRAGAVIMLPVPAFYTKPASIEDMVNQTVWRIIDHLGLPAKNLKRWES